jgi:hypothetical protein
VETSDIAHGALEGGPLFSRERSARFAELGGADAQIGQRGAPELRGETTDCRVTFGTYC